MSLNADTLIDRSYLKGQIAKWRLLAIFAVVLTVVIMVQELLPATPLSSSYIARVSVEGIIVDDLKRDELFDELRDDPQVKAVIIRMDSPGGTIVGGEQLYQNIKTLAAEKPVAVVMRSMATSAGYMATLGASRIFASKGTVTGSIGVIMQSAEFTELAKKLGIEPVVIKSGALKAVPNPMQPLTEEQRAHLQNTVMAFYDVFVDMVAENRKLPREKVVALADGRVVTGDQAVQYGLIDAIGAEADAKTWLAGTAKLADDIDVIDREPDPERPESMLDFIGGWAKNAILPEMRLDGLVSIWQAKPM